MHKVLIIEDDRAFSNICKTKLEAEGYKVVTAPDGQIGIQKFHSFKPQVVLLDLFLPKISGLEILNHIRSNHNTQDCAVVAFSGSSEFLKQAKNAGANKTISKDEFTPTQIVARVTEILSHLSPQETPIEIDLLPIAVDPRQSKGRVLIVEDDKATAMLVGKIVEDEGFTVETATDGMSGYKTLINEKDFALAIFDVNMPKLSGLDLLRLLRKDSRLENTPVILMSAQQPTHISFESFSTGIIVFVPKPFTKTTLKAMINLCLSQ